MGSGKTGPEGQDISNNNLVLAKWKNSDSKVIYYLSRAVDLLAILFGRENFKLQRQILFRKPTMGNPKMGD